jgi:type IV pilus assembly protein PilW
MVGMAVSSIVAAAAAASFHMLLSGYRTITEVVLLEERGARALAVLSGLIRHAGWRPTPPARGVASLPGIGGAENCGQPALQTGLHCARPGTNQSDALLVRFSGAGSATDPSRPDGSMTDCSGYPVAARWIDAMATPAHAVTNLLYIAADADGQPQLLCRYPSRRDGRIDGSGWTSGALVLGMESLQLRFGLDTTGDQLADTYVKASELADSVGGAPGWRHVRAVQVAFSLRSTHAGAAPAFEAIQPAFPPAPADSALADLQSALRTQPSRLRRSFATTVRLRNPAPCEAGAC